METESGTFSFVGGIVGLLGLANISDCENKAQIQGAMYGIGGIIGGCLSLGMKQIERCMNDGTIVFNRNRNRWKFC